MKKYTYEVSADIKANGGETRYVVNVAADTQKEAIQTAKAMWNKVSHLFHLKARKLEAHEKALYASWRKEEEANMSKEASAKTVSYRVYCQALSTLREKLGGDRRIEVYDMGGCFNEPVRLGVNWGALGTVPAAEAREFARQLTKAADAAETFEYNGYVIVHGEDA